jgi:hypothetical protein
MQTSALSEHFTLAEWFLLPYLRLITSLFCCVDFPLHLAVTGGLNPGIWSARRGRALPSTESHTWQQLHRHLLAPTGHQLVPMKIMAVGSVITMVDDYHLVKRPREVKRLA